MPTIDLPKNHEIAAVWRHDAPAGQAWKCPDCDQRATRGSNAAHHAMQSDHGVPVLVPHAPPKKVAPLPGVRVGDVMQVMDDVYLLLEVADAALMLAQISGAHPTTLVLLRGLYERAKASVEKRGRST